MEKNICVTSFYCFLPLADLDVQAKRKNLNKHGQDLSLKGLILIGPEGINAGVAGDKQKLDKFKDFVQKEFSNTEIFFKDHFTDLQPYRRFKVKIRNEIVTIGNTQIVPKKNIDHHMTPNDWNQVMDDHDVIVLDTRNTYEIEVGKFKGAKDLALDEFQQFPEKLKNSNLPKNKKYLIYCTGGIRCEKAILEMRNQGFDDVHQLYGGIINYLAQHPNEKYEGECFVFDHRVAVDQELKASHKFGLCPHCGQPGTIPIQCKQCGENEIVCQVCLDADVIHHTCSKNCAHHYRHGHTTKKPHFDGMVKRGKINF